ncbi:hypothetical protein [Paenibacillus sp. URB8-2]|uniref:hypothetical protein n=1 Tax=Paenibacillus sp. URB8-2 TaxID=2741301 RepID=UPI001E3331E0|nr:hypothetical protein [Paenibacillus sp. URB8-2]
MLRKRNYLFLIFLLCGIIALPSSVFGENENFSKLQNVKMTIGFSLGNGFGESVNVKLVYFTNGKRQVEYYSIPKKIELINDGETVDLKLSRTIDLPNYGVGGESGDTYTYKDKSGDILSFNAASKDTDHDSYILLFNYTKKP